MTDYENWNWHFIKENDKTMHENNKFSNIARKRERWLKEAAPIGLSGVLTGQSYAQTPSGNPVDKTINKARANVIKISTDKLQQRADAEKEARKNKLKMTENALLSAFNRLQGKSSNLFEITKRMREDIKKTKPVIIEQKAKKTSRKKKIAEMLGVQKDPDQKRVRGDGRVKNSPGVETGLQSTVPDRDMTD